MKRLLLFLVPLLGIALYVSLGGGPEDPSKALSGARPAPEVVGDPTEALAGPVTLTGPVVDGVDGGARVAAESAPDEAEDPAAAAAGGGSVSGRVVDAEEAPIAGAVVTLGLARGGLVVSITDAESEPSVTTGADGRFELRAEQESRQLELRVQASGFQTARRPVAPSAGADYPVGDLALVPGSIIAGEVVDADGRPVVDAALEVLQPLEAGVLAFGPRTGLEVARTDGEGRFRSGSLPEGGFELRITHPEHPDHLFEGRTAPNAPADRLRIELPLGVALEGRVEGDLAGRGLVVKAWHEAAGSQGFQFGGMGEGPSFTDVVRSGAVAADGSFRIGGLQPDEDLEVAVAVDEVFAPLEGPIVAARAPASGLLVPLHPAVAVQVDLIDASTGGPVELASAVLEGGDGMLGGLRMESERLVPSARPNGVVRLEDLRSAPGTEGLSLRVAAPGYEPWTSAPFALPAGGTLDLGQAALTPGPGILVEVHSRATGEPVAAARVHLTELQGATGGGGRTVRMAISSSPGERDVMAMEGDEIYRGSQRTDAEGRAHLVAPLEGRARVRITHPAFASVTAEVDVVPPTTLLRLPLDRPGTVLVHAVDASGQPLPGARIEHRSPGGDEMDAILGGIATDAEGEVRFARLDPGLHRFRIGKPQQQGMILFGMNTPTEEEVWTEVEVTAGGVHEATVSQKALAVVEGTVTLDGEPLSQARVSFRSSDAPDAFFIGGGGSSATTDAAGAFRIEGVEVTSGELEIGHPRLAMKHLEEVRTRAGTQRVDVALTLTSVEGQVLDESGAPVPEVRVSARPVEGTRQRVMMAFISSDGGGTQVLGGTTPTRTGPDGRYRLEGVRDGVELAIEVEGAGVCPTSRTLEPLGPGELLSDVDFEVLQGATLVARYAGGGEMLMLRCEYEGEGPLGEAVTPQVLWLEDGQVRKSGLTPGIWNLTLEEASGADAQQPLAERTVELQAGAEETVDL